MCSHRIFLRGEADKRVHFELCALIPEVIKQRDNLEETVKVLTS